MTPGNFILRTREFEQMEMEYFVRPDAEHFQLVDYWVEQYMGWYTGLGLARENLYLYEVPGEKLAHYSRRTVDIMYRYFPERPEQERQFEELMGIAYRTDFDLRQHSNKPEDAEGKRRNTGLDRRPLVLRRGGEGALLPARHRAGFGRQPLAPRLHDGRLRPSARPTRARSASS